MSVTANISDVPLAAAGLTVTTLRRSGSTWVDIQGEADIATFHQLRAGLATANVDGARLVHLHLFQLRFADLASVRELGAFTDELQLTGHRVVVCGASRVVVHVACFLDFDPALWRY
ncbi:MAG: hypothetical protein HOQ45_12945 [Nocardioidaceae bacterium]|nr:hypothetical protein [Nocardioidaceae bacterium]